MTETCKKRRASETQEMDSQLSINTEQFFTCENEPYIVWGQLDDDLGNSYKLCSRKTFFGREPQDTDYDEKSYTFDRRMNPTVYERISKTHLVIERKLDSINAENYEPAVITCLGRNGLTINGKRLSVSEKRLLVHGDVILLPPGYKLFQFFYTKPAECNIEYKCLIHKYYYIGESVGTGANGPCRKVFDLMPIDGEFKSYAMKSLAKPKETLHSTKEELFKKLMTEVEIMRQVDYVHVLQLFVMFESNQYILLVFPYMAGGDLLNKILNKETKCLNEHDAKYYFLQLSYGLKYLHSRGITHRDIKPENILLSDNGDYAILKIADFGLSKMNEIMKTQCGTELYVAPEVLRKKIYTNAVDLWAAGVVLFAMLTGKMPFSKNKHGTLRENILNCKYDFLPEELWDKLQDAQSIINSVLQINPKYRRTATELIEHIWLQDQSVIDRLQRAYRINNCVNEFVDLGDSETEALEKTLVNVSICEQEEVNHPPKRIKLN